MATITRIPVADRGMDISAGPLSVPSRKAPVVHNLLPGRNGRLPVRGPVSDPSGTFFTNEDPFSIYDTFWGNHLCAHGDVVFVTNGSVGGTEKADLGFTGAVEPATTTEELMTGPRWTQVRGDTYALSWETEEIDDTNVTGYDQAGWANHLPSHIIKISGPSGGTLADYNDANNPRVIVDIREHLDRLFVLGGNPPGTSTTDPFEESLFWSDIGGLPAVSAVSAWRDDATNLTNKVVLGGHGGRLMGLAKVGRNLAILRRNAIQMLYGETPTTFSLRTVIREMGCIDQASITEYGEGVYFLSNEGIVWFDGDTIQVVSQPIQPILNYHRGTYRLSGCRIGLEYVLFAYTSGNTGGSGYLFLFHTPTQSWSTISADENVWPLWGGTLQRVWNTGSHAIGWDGQQVWELDDIIRSESPASQDPAGKDVGDGGYFYIPTRYETPLISMGSPASNGFLERVTMSYANQLAPGNEEPSPPEDPEDAGFTVMVGNRQNRDAITNGTPLIAPAQEAVAESSATAIGTIPYALAVWDLHAETRDVQVIVEGPTGQCPNAEAKYTDIGDIHIEWSATRPR